MLTLLSWLAGCYLVAYLAEIWGRGKWNWFFISFILSPVISLLILLIIPRTDYAFSKGKNTSGRSSWSIPHGNGQDIFTMEGLFSSNGRRSRWPFFLCNAAASVLMLVSFALGAATMASFGLTFVVFGFWAIVGGLISISVGFFNTAKRCHDLNLPTSWAVLFQALQILSFITMASGIGSVLSSVLSLAGFYLLLAPGTPGPNAYGSEPLKS